MVGTGVGIGIAGFNIQLEMLEVISVMILWTRPDDPTTVSQH